MNIEIRSNDATPEALAAVQAESWRDAYRGLFPDDWLDERMEAELVAAWEEQPPAGEDFVLSAWAQDALAGFALVRMRDDAGFIEHLHVRPALRGAGVDEALLREIAARLAAAGRDAMWLWTFERNTDALASCERLGARRSGGAVNKIFGHRVPCIRLAWEGLAPLTAQFRGPVPTRPEKAS
jgi:ribosomal protein S18 acetylase RimI-like enzyme